MEIQDKVALITGASGGIGLATARRFAEAGAKVVLAARSAGRLDEIADDLRGQGYTALAVPTDMTDQAAVDHLVKTAHDRYGRIDALINNAGQAAAGRIADLNIGHMRQIMELNIFGVIYAMQAVIPSMREQGGGIIVNISSMVSKMHIPGLAAYAATKAALNMLSDTARGELAEENIRVITVYPRLTSTDFGKNSLGNQQTRQHQRSNWQRDLVIDRPEFVADKILAAVEKEPAEQYMDA